ncbi:MAG: hypothetical protein RL701_6728 [Pseudomonadota bacterium]
MHTPSSTHAHAEIERQTPLGFRAQDEIERARDEADVVRAIAAYTFFYPSVSLEGVLNGQREAGAEDNKHAVLIAGAPRHVLFTGNSDTPYLGSVLDLQRFGPAVIELPPGPYVGIVNDHHFRFIHDMGLAGPDAGRGGKHLILPPDSRQVTPDYHVAHANTHKLLIGIRALPNDGDLAGAVEALQRVKIYPLAEAADTAAVEILNLTEHRIDLTCLRWETNIRFWDKLHKVLDEEPVVEEFRPMYGLLATLGIEKGKAFAPDARMKSILDRAAKIGRNQLLDAGFASRRGDRRVWHDRNWEWIALRSENGDFEAASGIDIEARNRWFSQAIGASPAMFRRTPGAGSLYWLGLRDQHGAYLDGSKTYKLTVPQPVPAKLFWSITLYDAVTRSQLQTSQERAALRSRFELKGQTDSAALELYFGPKAPPGKAAHWLQTLPGKGFFAYFRIYGPEAAAFAGTWKPGDFERI